MCLMEPLMICVSSVLFVFSAEFIVIGASRSEPHTNQYILRENPVVQSR